MTQKHFTNAELKLIHAALVMLRDSDAANSWKPDDECDEEAKACAELIHQIEESRSIS